MFQKKIASSVLYLAIGIVIIMGFGCVTSTCLTAIDSPNGNVPFGTRACSFDGSKYAREIEPGNQGHIGVFNAANDALLTQANIGEVNNDLKGLAWSRDNHWLAVMFHHASGGIIALVDALTGSTPTSIPISFWAHSLRFEDDQHIVADGQRYSIDLPATTEEPPTPTVVPAST